MTITAKDVQKLREQTSVGMMDCKKALTETNGDFEKAVQYLREKGLAKAAKKADRDANEGAIFTAVNSDRTQAAIIVLNCETDFVSGNDIFKSFGQRVAQEALNQSVSSVDQLTIDGKSVTDATSEIVSQVGENTSVKLVQLVSGQTVQDYIHLNGKIGVVVGFDNAVDETVAKDIAMQVAAVNPQFIDPSQVPSDNLEQEREIIANQARNEGKPEPVIEKIVDGRIQKYYKETCLIKQEFIKDNSQTIQDILPNNTTVTAMHRFSIG